MEIANPGGKAKTLSRREESNGKVLTDRGQAMASARKTLVSSAGGRRRKPLSDRTNLRDSPKSCSSSSLSLPKPTLFHDSCNRLTNPGDCNDSATNPNLAVPGLGVAEGAGAGAGADLSTSTTTHHQRRHADKRKCHGAMVAMPAVSDTLGKLDELKECKASKSIVLADKRQKRHSRVRPQKEPDRALEDFITQQRLYFAEVDAYELEEEEVTLVEDLE